ncbi:nicotinate-nucleotide--dimethylbenzimidazole phosphoribosyltransferase [Sedimentibacter sp. MB31-C6]|uniref:nicotinate-nucleotide--dimethylbenzimidazole phosphoribosyltransferase n=1 Tax=Sedimentibacter sp. MB31-C6 TaxID=3109366 RepID=UPI002DDCEAE7|nr:nicotinate-nucleotide--dimethylbenzimidazole phosphoribosyltransferase [Sedimentibacter sp. MB36-C1]WSI03215.1 nicotinate-nucleotide--dimethylbenzimidazole phosphoribosyltransferase [Sedimentibacter sp. MB36-C1]
MNKGFCKNLNIKSKSERELELILNDIVKGIKRPDLESAKKMQERLDAKIKPIRSLGVLEDLAVQLAGIQRTAYPEIKGKAVLLMAGDHGVVKEGVSAASQELTAQLFNSYLSGVGGINVLANHAGAKLICSDIGMACSIYPSELMVNRIKNGTDNIAEGSAMTREEALRSLLTGAKVASDAIESGINILAIGEVGIGNTTPSAALITVFTGCSVEEATGSGTGLKKDALKHKCEIIKKAIKINKPNHNDPIDVLTKIGGLEIAAMVGAILEAAYQNVPTILDGIISVAAALVATRLNPIVVEYLIASHTSEEKGQLKALKYMGLEPRLLLNMRLGEGTGAALMFPVVDVALKIADEMATFEDSGVTTGDF